MELESCVKTAAHAGFLGTKFLYIGSEGVKNYCRQSSIVFHHAHPFS